MQLVTTMGIELTYMPVIWDWLAEQYGKKYNKRLGNKKAELAEVVAARGQAVHFGAVNLRNILHIRNIKFNNCGTDPDCVEVSTKPYKSLDSLMRRAHIISLHAGDLELSPTLHYFNGGGAHIHTGSDFMDGDRDNYVKRMMVFAAQNPWLSWAFVGLSDDCNAEPLTRRQLHMFRQRETLEDLKDQLARSIEELLSREARLHQSDTWDNQWSRDRRSSFVRLSQEDIMVLRLRIARYARTDNETSFPLYGMIASESKDHVMRYHSHYKTCEFRAFEMPEDVSVLAKYVRLANAICTYVSKQTYTVFDSTLIPKNGDELRMMPLEARVEGFRKMLELVGMDPAEFKAEEQQIAKRFSRYRDKAYQVKQARLAKERQQREAEELLRASMAASLEQAREVMTPEAISEASSITVEAVIAPDVIREYQRQNEARRTLRQLRATESARIAAEEQNPATLVYQVYQLAS